MIINAIHSEHSPLHKMLLQLQTEHSWVINFFQGIDYQNITELPKADVVILDATENFDEAIANYGLLRHRQHIKSSPIIVSKEYQHSEASALASIAETYYLVIPPSLTDLIDYLQQFSRSQHLLLNRFTSLLEGELGHLLNNTTIISVTDRIGRICYANDLFCQISGYQRQELIGKTHRLVKSDHHDKEFYQQMWNTISDGRVWQGNICNTRKDGTNYWVRSEIHPICDLNGQPILYCSLRSEISNEIRLSQQLTESDNRFRTSHNFANIGIWERSINDSDFYCSDEMRRLLGHKETAVFDYQQFLHAIHAGDRPQVKQQLDLCEQSGSEYSIEYRVNWPDGSIRWLAQKGYATRSAEGKPDKIYGTVIDIHDMKVAQQEISEAHQIKTDFISSLSHEVRNPLNAISGYAQLLKNSLESNAYVKERADKIHSISNYIIELLRDIDDFSRFEAGNVSSEISSISLAELVNESRHVIDPLLGDISYQQSIEDIYILADQRHLKQSIINIVSNAIKYNKSNGQVSISSHLADSGKAILRITDTGQGIAQHELEKIFQPFERLGWANSSVDGLGLGLSLTKLMIEDMGGQLQISSEINVGTQVIIELPVDSSASITEDSESTNIET